MGKTDHDNKGKIILVKLADSGTNFKVSKHYKETSESTTYSNSLYDGSIADSNNNSYAITSLNSNHLFSNYSVIKSLFFFLNIKHRHMASFHLLLLCFSLLL